MYQIEWLNVDSFLLRYETLTKTSIFIISLTIPWEVPLELIRKENKYECLPNYYLESQIVILQDYCDHTCLKQTLTTRAWRGGSAVKSTGCSCRGSKLGNQQPAVVTSKHLKFSFTMCNWTVKFEDILT